MKMVENLSFIFSMFAYNKPVSIFDISKNCLFQDN